MSSNSQARKMLVAVFILAVVAVAGLASYLAFLRPENESYTVKPVSSVTASSLVQTSVTTQTISSSKITTTAPSVQWITIEKTRSTSYYLTLLESNGTTPYVQLAAELRKLPDLQNATAVATIVYLALNATNPEVKEAFQLMMNGGTPNPSDFKGLQGYNIPHYNTELQILYWLAAQRQLRRDDTLALSISMPNGLWVTIGDIFVREQVRKDVVDLLDFFRDTDRLQQDLGFPRLELLPLEAKVALAWLGGDSGTHGPHAITGQQSKHDSLNNPMNLHGYEWDNVNITTLRQMRDHMKQEDWVTSSIDQTVATVEDYFFFSGRKIGIHFDYVTAPRTILVNGETVSANNMNNANFNFQYYLKNGEAVGVCEDEMTLVSALLKSWGIATLPQLAYRVDGGHTYTMFYDESSRAWKVTPYQIGVVFYHPVQDAYIFLPPILQNEFIPTSLITPQEAAVPWAYQIGEVNTEMFVPMYNITGSYLKQYANGVGTDQIRRWILYKVKPPKSVTRYSTWSDQDGWNVINDESKDLVDENGKIVGDLSQPYVDLASVSYSHSNESLFFRFALHGDIPHHLPRNVSDVWYQVFLDVDSDNQTGYHWSSDFTPDYRLQFMIYREIDNSITIESKLLQHCGGAQDWCWTSIAFAARYGPTTYVAGGTGSDYIVVSCDYGDIMVSHASTIRFFAQSGIDYDEQLFGVDDLAGGVVSIRL